MWTQMNIGLLLAFLHSCILDSKAISLTEVIKRDTDGDVQIISKRNLRVCNILCAQGKGMNLCDCNEVHLPGKRTYDSSLKHQRDAARSAQPSEAMIGGTYLVKDLLKRLHLDSKKNKKNSVAGYRAIFADQDNRSDRPASQDSVYDNAVKSNKYQTKTKEGEYDSRRGEKSELLSYLRKLVS